MKEERQVWEYTVYWINYLEIFYGGNLSHKCFATKKDAKEFARKQIKSKKKHCKDMGESYHYIKPFIYKRPKPRNTFRKDVNVEYLTESEINKYVRTWHDSTILIKY